MVVVNINIGFVMKIIHRKVRVVGNRNQHEKELINIQSISELEKYISDNKILGEFISFPSEFHDFALSLVCSDIEIHKQELRSVLPLEFRTNHSKWSARWWIIRGYSADHAAKYISEKNRINSNKYVNKRKSNPERYNDIYTNQKQYWIKLGYSEQEAIDKIKERQDTRSLAKLCKIYGDEIGNKKYIEYNERYSNTMNNKSSNEKYEILKKKMVGWCRASAESIAQFKEALEFLDNNNIKYYIGMNENSEYFIREPKSKNIYFYDLTIMPHKLIIEYNGSRWHPTDIDDKWKSSFCMNDTPCCNECENNPTCKKSAFNIMNHDKRKIKVAENAGFKVLSIYSDKNKSHFTNNQIIMTFLKENIKIN